MPRTRDDPTLFVPKASAEFRRANPDAFGKAQGDLETTRRLGAIETRAEAIKQRFYDHFARHEEMWVAWEAMKLVAKRTFPTFNHPAPRGFEPRRTGQDYAELMMASARQNVHARAILRLAAISTAKARMHNAVIRNTPRPVRGPNREPSNDHKPPKQRRWNL